VTFAGYVPQDQLGPYYRTADLFVLSSDFDNSPNVVLEAMACGLPAVSTNVGGAAEYIVPGQGGDLVAARDENALAGAIEHWLNDADRRRTAGHVQSASVSWSSSPGVRAPNGYSRSITR
jgi:glycosyltransferase involved in cell wall biosynthesis